MLIKKLSKVGLSLLLTASFSISAFAGYDFSEDGNTHNTEYNGTNTVYSNGIYVGTDPVTGLPIYKFEMDNIQNTYNGETTIHGNGDALFDGYDQYGTYTGTLDVVGTDVGPGTTTTISNANINANTSISAADAVADNDLNAGVLIKDSTFTKDVTVQSSNVYLDENANVILGSSSQMDQLNTTTGNIYTLLNTALNTYVIPLLKDIRRYIMILGDSIYITRQTSDVNSRRIEISNNSTLGTVAYTLSSCTLYTGYSFNNGTFTWTTETKYGNFNYLINTAVNNFALQFRAYVTELFNSKWTYDIPYFSSLRRYIMILTDSLYISRVKTDPNDRVVTLSTDPVLGSVSYTLSELARFNGYTNNNGVLTFTEETVYGNYQASIRNYFNNNRYVMKAYLAEIWKYFYGYDSYTIYDFITQDQYYQFSSRTASCSWRDVVVNRLDIIIKFLHYYCTRFFEWYYPLDSTAPMYWRTYNSDTDNMENVNLARVLYDISWYLGHITIGDDIADDVQSLSDNLTSYQAAEQTLQNRVSQSIQSFLPDVSMFSGLTAITFVRNWLQNLYLALGSYGSVMMVGLLLGVCMQFIGYFRYKY